MLYDFEARVLSTPILTYPFDCPYSITLLEDGIKLNPVDEKIRRILLK